MSSSKTLALGRLKADAHGKELLIVGAGFQLAAEQCAKTAGYDKICFFIAAYPALFIQMVWHFSYLSSTSVRRELHAVVVGDNRCQQHKTFSMGSAHISQCFHWIFPSES
ncbi:hypothetical protein ACTACM_13645 [Pseudomonas fragariae (ex Marin et al. 2024)]|uniref:hypothetical protein n=1 Tax=Pseudomonas TaxID=286 RepID=UPI0015D5653B|nr:hypothetical protein [Pseudomonas syringae]